MDRELIYAVYFHPRTDKGALQVKQEVGPGLRGQFVANLRRYGIVEPEWHERFWREWQAKEKAKPAPVPVKVDMAARVRAEKAKVARVKRPRKITKADRR